VSGVSTAAGRKSGNRNFRHFPGLSGVREPIILAIIYGGEERGQMINEKVGEQGQQYSREHRCVFHEKIVTLIDGS